MFADVKPEDIYRPKPGENRATARFMAQVEGKQYFLCGEKVLQILDNGEVDIGHDRTTFVEQWKANGGKVVTR